MAVSASLGGRCALLAAGGCSARGNTGRAWCARHHPSAASTAMQMDSTRYRFGWTALPRTQSGMKGEQIVLFLSHRAGTRWVQYPGRRRGCMNART
jgi:hypothetical protein